MPALPDTALARAEQLAERVLPDRSPKRRMLVIVNPYASTVSDRLKNLVVYALQGRYQVEAVDTERRDHATQICREAASEGYDAVVIIALAAEQAKSTKGVDIASEINGITKDGEKCTTFRQCRDIIDIGGNPDYDGVTGTLDFTAAGEGAVGSYGILTFNSQNKIDTAATQYRIVGAR